ncbi:podocalyxin [Erinaceus europaeus]|uniref:Podocalyxin n=1 Tax=Erinaceus europaeus TaxID=9365 RepID=A0A1S3WCP0_ERIEU|nr:podocalyxin [Erinaceus europaeus]
MRPVLALPALLLLLLLPPPAVPETPADSPDQPAADAIDTPTTAKPTTKPITQAPVTDPGTSPTTASPSTATGDDQKGAAVDSSSDTVDKSGSPVTSQPPVTPDTKTTTTPVNTGDQPPTKATATTTAVGGGGHKGPDKTTPLVTTLPTKPGTTQGPSGATGVPGVPGDQGVTTITAATKGGSQAATLPTDLTTSQNTAAPGTSATQPTNSLATLGSLTSLPGGSGKATTAPSSSEPVTGPTSRPQGTSVTPTTTVALPGSQPTSSQLPGVTRTSHAVPRTPSSETTQPASPSPGSVATHDFGGSTGSNTPLASTVPYSHHSSPTPTPSTRVECEHSEKLTEYMLVLNLTTPDVCVKSLPDDNLVKLVCQAAKPSFDSRRDECILRLAPVPENDFVAIKEITIRTKLPPKEVFELLKDKWDDLKVAGISDMRLGEQGPPEEAEDRFSMPLIITIVCMASFLLLVAAIYGCCHQRLSQRKDQQRLTEELQTVENGYHDNPTLEVMETSSEMQEKKVVSLNGELGDSWIVPLDNLTKDDLDEEEDTHL